MLVLLAILFTINLYGRINIFNTSYILHKQFSQILQDQYWPFVLFWNLKPLYLTCSHSFSFIVPLAVIRCHSMSLVVPVVLIRCHSLYQSLSLDVTLVCLFLNDPAFVYFWKNFKLTPISSAKTCNYHFLLITCYGPLKPKLENLCLEKKIQVVE